MRPAFPSVERVTLISPLDGVPLPAKVIFIGMVFYAL
jgi:hypothetical protein